MHIDMTQQQWIQKLKLLATSQNLWSSLSTIFTRIIENSSVTGTVAIYAHYGIVPSYVRLKDRWGFTPCHHI
jgi:hypothetical protein